MALILHCKAKQDFRAHKAVVAARLAKVALECVVDAACADVRLETPDGTLCESNAILRFIGQSGCGPSLGLCGQTLLDQAQVNQWLEFAAGELEPAVLLEAVGDAFERSIGVLSEHCVRNTYLVGNRVTVADIAVVAALSSFSGSKLPAAVQRWLATCTSQLEWSSAGNSSVARSCTATMEKHASGMRYAKLGLTGPCVSEICLGTMNWGSQIKGDDKIFAMIDRFVEAGGNFIDTAEMYPVPPAEDYVGETECIIGRWLAARGPDMRKKITVATKVCGPSPRGFVLQNRTDPKTENIGDVVPNLDRANIRSAWAASCRRLQTDYLDIFYLHWPSRPLALFGKSVYTASMKDKHPFFGNGAYTTIQIEESVRAMGELIKEDKIKAWAISNENAFGIGHIMNVCAKFGVDPPCCIQNDFSLCDRRFEAELAEACAAWNYNIAGVPYGLLCGGALSGKYIGGKKPEGVRHTLFPDFQPRYVHPATADATAKYAEVAQQAKLSLTVLALAWARTRFFNQSLIVGVSNMEQLNECLGTVNVELSEQTQADIDKIHFQNKNPNVQF